MCKKDRLVCICCKMEETNKEAIEQIQERFNENDLFNIPYICPDCEKRLNDREYEMLTGMSKKKLHIRHKKFIKNNDNIV